MAGKKTSYTLLQKKMKEIEKPKKLTSRRSTNSNSKENAEVIEIPRKPALDPSKEAHRQNPNIPDRSYGDYFCQICDSHMNSDGMWEAHITGKRHIKNVKKGDTDTKYEVLDEESSLTYEIRNVKDPIIGLNYLHEIRRKTPGIPPMYNCFLCHASIATKPLVIEHVIGLKHRLNFIKENESEEFQLLESTNLKKNLLEPLVAETAAKLEAKLGRGEVKVKVEKPKAAIPYKRSYDSDDDDRVATRKAAKSHRPEETKVPVWKSIDIPKRDEREFDSRRRTSEYYRHEDRSDSKKIHYRDSTSQDRDHSRQSEKDSYSRSYGDNYPNEYLRSDRSAVSRYNYERSPERDSRYKYERSPERDRLPSISDYRDRLPSISETRDALYTSSRLESDSRTFQSHAPTVFGPQPPPISNAQQIVDPAAAIKDFISQLKNLPPEHFLKIVLMKLQEMPELNKTAMELLMKVFSSCQQVICSNLPPQIQAIFKDKLTQQSSENVQSSGSNNAHASSASRSSAARSTMSQGGQNAEDRSNAYINDINELVFGARKASESSSINQQSHTTNYNATPNVSSALASNFPPPPTFIPHSPNYAPPPANFQQPQNFSSASNNIQQVSAMYQPPSNEFASPSSYSSYTPYDANPSASGIPGLTLTEHESSQNQNYSKYKWEAPKSNDSDFRRY